MCVCDLKIGWLLRATMKILFTLANIQRCNYVETLLYALVNDAGAVYMYIQVV